MKNLSLSEFMNSLVDVLTGVTQNGDIVRVESERSGAFVVMEEAEYKILLDALRAVFTVAGSVEADGNTIEVRKLLEKLGK